MKKSENKLVILAQITALEKQLKESNDVEKNRYIRKEIHDLNEDLKILES